MTDLGQIINNLGCSADSIEAGCMPTDAVVLVKCVDEEGSVSLFMAHSKGMSWIERLGMLRAAECIESADYRRGGDDD